MGWGPFFHESPDGVHGPTLRAWLGTSYLPKVSRGPPDSRPEAESRHEAPVEIQRMVSPKRRRVMTLRQICHMGEVSLPRVGVKTMAPPPPAHTLRERDDTRWPARGPLRSAAPICQIRRNVIPLLGSALLSHMGHYTHMTHFTVGHWSGAFWGVHKFLIRQVAFSCSSCTEAYYMTVYNSN